MELGLVFNHGEATVTNKQKQKFNLVTAVPAAVPIAVSSPTPPREAKLPITKAASVTVNAIQRIKIAKTSAMNLGNFQTLRSIRIRPSVKWRNKC